MLVGCQEWLSSSIWFFQLFQCTHALYLCLALVSRVLIIFCGIWSIYALCRNLCIPGYYRTLIGSWICHFLKPKMIDWLLILVVGRRARYFILNFYFLKLLPFVQKCFYKGRFFQKRIYPFSLIVKPSRETRAYL